MTVIRNQGGDIVTNEEKIKERRSEPVLHVSRLRKGIWQSAKRDSIHVFFIRKSCIKKRASKPQNFKKMLKIFSILHAKAAILNSADFFLGLLKSYKTE